MELPNHSARGERLILKLEVALGANRFRRYGLAVLLSALGLLATSLVKPFVHTGIFPFSLLAVAITALLGGFGPGIVAVVLSALANDYYITPPIHQITLHQEPAEQERLLIFLFLSLLISWLNSMFRTAYRRSTESELKTREALRAREEFISIASHEFKNPISAVYMKLQLAERIVKENPQHPKLRELLSSSKLQCQRISELIEKLLDVTRIQVGKIELNLAPTDLVALVKEVTQRFSTELNQKGISMEIVAPQILTGTWDRVRLDQIITNLLSNAIKYGDAKPIQIKVEGTHDRVKVRVTDQGIGIAPRDQDRIFQRFERASSSARISGLGLGLYVSGQIATAHGGTLFVKSELGHGSTFTLDLPLRVPKTTSPVMPESAA